MRTDVKAKDVLPIPSRARSADPRAFTLVELMACVAIGLMLIVGVNQVFRVASDTVGAGQALASAVRDYRAVQPVLYGDLSAAAMPYATNGTVLDDGPFLLIRSERMTMFRSRADQATDRDGDPATTDVNGDNIDGDKAVPGEVVRTTDLSERSHRLDRLMFFTRGMFRRQTGGALSSSDATGAAGGPFAADMTCDEAFVWYGHLKLPDYTTRVSDARKYAPRAPGERLPPTAPPSNTQPQNSSNYYASDWALGRVAIGLARGVDTDGDGTGDVLRDRRGVPQKFLRRTASDADASSLAPLHAAFAGRRVTAQDGWELEWSRYDLANTSLVQFRQVLSRYVAAPNPVPWHHLISPMQFEADPLPARPLTAASAARTVPILLPHCSQFAVEFAGDFVTQDRDDAYDPTPAQLATEDGTVLRAQPDGVLDFVVLPDGSRNTRWYGLPRDLDGDGVVPGGRSHNNQMPDVVPLRDVRRTATVRPPRDEAPFERMLDARGRPRLPLPAGGDYAKSMAADATYVVAWGPDTAASPRPSMLRIVFSVDDPAGRLPAPQTYQYVVKLP